MSYEDYGVLTRNYTEMIDNELKAALLARYPDALREAMEYAVFPGGKRIRPLLMLAACMGAGGDDSVGRALPFAAALEMIHSYSLIHDDLPAIDNDDMRRGKPSCHKKFGEAAAILAGDGLLNRAYEHMSAFIVKNPRCELVLAMSRIACSAGAEGMIGGQFDDVVGKNTVLDKEWISHIHARKTSALFCAAFEAGALAGGSDKAADFGAAGMAFGLAFQIQDDLADFGADKTGEASYPAVAGYERAQADMSVQAKKAFALVSDLCGADSFLAYIIKEISFPSLI